MMLDKSAAFTNAWRKACKTCLDSFDPGDPESYLILDVAHLWSQDRAKQSKAREALLLLDNAYMLHLWQALIQMEDPDHIERAALFFRWVKTGQSQHLIGDAAFVLGTCPYDPPALGRAFDVALEAGGRGAMDRAEFERNVNMRALEWAMEHPDYLPALSKTLARQPTEWDHQGQRPWVYTWLALANRKAAYAEHVLEQLVARGIDLMMKDGSGHTALETLGDNLEQAWYQTVDGETHQTIGLKNKADMLVSAGADWTVLDPGKHGALISHLQQHPKVRADRLSTIVDTQARPQSMNDNVQSLVAEIPKSRM